MKNALGYADRARQVAPEQIHLQFNIAFVQNEMAQLVINIPESQKTSQDIEEATEGLDEAIAAFDKIASAKNPPYPRSSLESRATMGRNTIKNQLQRALSNQKEYEEKNAAKLQQARDARDAEMKKREEIRRKQEEEELERKRKIAEDRQRMVEEANRLVSLHAEEERSREAAEYTTDSETGDRVKRKKKGSGKRKKKGDDEPSGRSKGRRATESATPATSDVEGEEPAPRKKRRLERRSTAKSSKFKSSEIVVESESEDEAGVSQTNGARNERSSPASDNDEEMQEAGDKSDADEEEVVQRRRNKVNLRIEDDEDEDEEEGEAPVKSPANAGAGAEEDEDEGLFDEKSVTNEDNEGAKPDESAADVDMKDSNEAE